MRRFARSSTSTTAPSGRPRWSRPLTRTAARSPCIIWRISPGGRNTDGLPSSGTRKAVAVGMALDAPGDERNAPCHEQAARAVLHHLAGALERE
jgi:hypothetical protein